MLRLPAMENAEMFSLGECVWTWEIANDIQRTEVI
jgi:hypothetical protein